MAGRKFENRALFKDNLFHFSNKDKDYALCILLDQFGVILTYTLMVILWGSLKYFGFIFALIPSFLVYVETWNKFKRFFWGGFFVSFVMVWIIVYLSIYFYLVLPRVI